MLSSLTLRILVSDPVPGVLGGVQEGRGSAAIAVQCQRPSGPDLVFEIPLQVHIEDHGVRFAGPFVQKDAKGPFVYLRWGISAGEKDTPIDRRAKLYLHPLTELILRAVLTDGQLVSARVHGRAKDGWPCCATVPVHFEV